MGVLTARGSMPEGGGEPAEKEAPDPSTNTDAPDEKPEVEKSEFVPFSTVEKHRTPGSRRARAAAETEALLNERLKPLEEGWKTERSKYEERLSQQAQEFARMQGQLEALSRMPAPQPAAVPKPDLPDPDKLMQEAEAALDAKDIRTYHAKLTAAHRAHAQRLTEEQVAVVRREFEARIPQQMPPEVQVLMARHPTVAMSGQMGIDAVLMKDRELHYYRQPPGPQRLAKAFELAEQMIDTVNGRSGASSAKKNGYSQDAAQALSAVPTTRSVGGGGSGGEEGHTLTPLERKTVKDLGWDAATYVRWKFPEKFVKR